MRNAAFVEHIPEVVPHLVAISEMDPEFLRNSGPVFEFKPDTPEGTPATEETGRYRSDEEELTLALTSHANYVCTQSDALIFARSSVEDGLGALIRLSESDLDRFQGRERAYLGANALAMTNRTADVASRLGPLVRSGSPHIAVPLDPPRFEPSVQIPKHREHYAAIMTYLRRPLRRHLQGYLFP